MCAVCDGLVRFTLRPESSLRTRGGEQKGGGEQKELKDRDRERGADRGGERRSGVTDQPAPAVETKEEANGMVRTAVACCSVAVLPGCTVVARGCDVRRD